MIESVWVCIRKQINSIFFVLFCFLMILLAYRYRFFTTSLATMKVKLYHWQYSAWNLCRLCNEGYIRVKWSYFYDNLSTCSPHVAGVTNLHNRLVIPLIYKLILFVFFKEILKTKKIHPDKFQVCLSYCDLTWNSNAFWQEKENLFSYQ